MHTICWDLYEKAMQQAKIKVAIDAGANDGGYTTTLLRNGFEVHSFEPVPQMFQKMKDLHGANPKAHLNNLGLSNKSEVIKDVTVLECWTIGQPGLGGLSVSPQFSGEQRFDMKTTTLDEYLGPKKIGLFKLDVDGYEYRVLKGAEKTIRRDKPPILCEFGCYLQKIGDDPKTFIDFIFDLGYLVSSLDGKSYYHSWDEVKPEYPFNTTFDVMLLPV